jgi:RNA polymerase sigma factor (sigma-70 family)
MVSLDALTEDASSHLSVQQAVAADEDEALRAHALARMAAALDELPERDRILLRGAFFDDRSYEQLAQEVGVKPDSVGQLLYRAKDKLKKMFGATDLEKLSVLILIALSSLWDLGT